MQIVTSTELQNNFGKYLQAVIDGENIMINKNGENVAQLVSQKSSISFLTDSLKGVLKEDYDDKKMNKKRIYEHESFS